MLKIVSHVDFSSFALRSNLASLKTEVGKLDINKLTPVPDNLAKLSNVVKSDVVKKTEYDELVTKVNGIDTTNFVSKTKYEKDRSDFEDKISKIDKKIPDVSGLVKKKKNFNTKATEIEDKIPSITSLGTNSELTAIENGIPDFNGLIKKTDYDTKITAIEKKITNHDHDKYITIPEFNTTAASTFNARFAAQTDLIKKPEFDANLMGISDRVTKNKTKHLLVENGLKKLKTLDLSYFGGKNYFEGNDGARNALVFQTMQKHFNLSNVNQIRKWK